MGIILIVVGLVVAFLPGAGLVGLAIAGLGLLMAFIGAISGDHLQAKRALEAELRDIKLGRPEYAKRRETVQVAIAAVAFAFMLGGFYAFIK